MKLIIADDHDLVRDALALLIRQGNEAAEVLTAKDYPEARRLLLGNRDCDLLLLDVFMPGMDDLSGLRETVETHPDTPVVLMSGMITEGMVKSAFDQGAMGFIPKTLSGQALLSILNMVIAGVRYVPDIVLEDRARAPGPNFALSPRELETLQQLAKGLSNKVIARNLSIEETTVKLHLRSLFRKMDVSNRTEAVIVARDNGLLSSAT